MIFSLAFSAFITHIDTFTVQMNRRIDVIRGNIVILGGIQSECGFCHRTHNTLKKRILLDISYTNKTYTHNKSKSMDTQSSRKTLQFLR